MNWKSVSLSFCVVAAIGCGDDNGSTNNGATNNGTSSNNTATNSNTSTTNAGTNNGTATNNNATSNNAATNNSTSNNAATNSSTNSGNPDQVCSLSEQDSDGNMMAETTVKAFYEDEDWEHPVRQVVKQSASLLQSNTYMVENEWDDDGNLLSQLVDFGNDGTTEWVISFEYDDMGNTTLFAFDNDNDGDAEFLQRAEFDEFGQNTRFEADGVFEPATWMVSEEADGTPNSIATHDWYGEGKSLHLRYDADNDGNLEYEVTSTYDGDGNLTRVEQDGALGSSDFDDLRIPADGTTDVVIEYTYDASGNMLTERQDGFWRPAVDEDGEDLLEGIDGTWDFERIDIVSDAERNPTGWRQDGRRAVDGSWSIQADGTFDRFQNVTFQEVVNEPGTFVLTALEFDEGDDGSVDFSVTRTINDDGALTHREVDGVIDDGNNLLTPADGTAQDVADLTWLAPDELVSYERDFDGDGTLDIELHRTYNDSQQLTLHTRDGDLGIESYEFGPDGPADGVIDHRVSYTYDDEGRYTSGIEERLNDEGMLVKTWGFEQAWADCADFEL